MNLLCPKCTNAMHQYERNDVVIDQCVECGGIFLDRGELERLAQAEANYYNPQNAQPLPPRRPRTDPRDDDRRDDRYYEDRRRDDRRYDDRRYDDRRYDDRRYDDRRYDDRRYDQRDRDYDPRYDRGKYGKRRKKESFFGELMDIFD
ncbi:MAG: zf-TFIIB domain-containing protein [Cumulibacter sp.]